MERIAHRIVPRVTADCFRDVPGALLAVLGMGLALLVKESSVLATFQSLETEDAGVSTMLAGVAFFLALAAVYWRYPRFRLHRHPAVGVIIALVVTVSMLVMYGQVALDVPAWAHKACHIAQRIGGALLIILWCEALFPLGSQRFGVLFSLALVASGGFIALAGTLTAQTAATLVSSCPLLSVTCIYFFRELNASRSGHSPVGVLDRYLTGALDFSACLLGSVSWEGQADAAAAAPHEGRAVRARVVLALLTLLLVVLCGRYVFASTHFIWANMQNVGNAPLVGQFANALGAVLAGLLLFALANWLWGRNAAAYAIILMTGAAFAATSMSLLIDDGHIWWYLVPMSAGVKISYFLVVESPFFLYTGRPGALIGAAFAASEFGVALYALLSLALGSQALGVVQTLLAGAVLVGAAVCLLLAADQGKAGADAAAVGMPAAQEGATRQAAEGAARAPEPCDAPKSEDAPASRVGGLAPHVAMRDVCLQLAGEQQLTRRETEIFLLLADRYNAQAIAEILVVTVATTKTHMRNIYAKLDVHSQKELQDLIAARARTDGELG